MCRVFVGLLGVLERTVGMETPVPPVLPVHLEVLVQRDTVETEEMTVPRDLLERLVLRARLETQAPTGLL